MNMAIIPTSYPPEFMQDLSIFYLELFVYLSYVCRVSMNDSRQYLGPVGY